MSLNFIVVRKIVTEQIFCSFSFNFKFRLPRYCRKTVASLIFVCMFGPFVLGSTRQPLVSSGLRTASPEYGSRSSTTICQGIGFVHFSWLTYERSSKFSNKRCIKAVCVRLIPQNFCCVELKMSLKNFSF